MDSLSNSLHLLVQDIVQMYRWTVFWAHTGEDWGKQTLEIRYSTYGSERQNSGCASFLCYVSILFPGYAMYCNVHEWSTELPIFYNIGRKAASEKVVADSCYCGARLGLGIHASHASLIMPNKQQTLIRQNPTLCFLNRSPMRLEVDRL